MQTIMQQLNLWGNIAIFYNIINIILFVLLSVTYSCVFVFINLKSVAILQQNHYFNLPTLKWIVSLKNKTINWFYLFVDVFAFVVVTQFFICFNLTFWVYYVLFVALICYLFCFGVGVNAKQLKKPLVVTSRVKRLIVTSVIIYSLVCFVIMFLAFKINTYFVYGLIVVSFFNSAIILLSNLINLPIEQLIKQYYIHKAKQKLQSYKHITIVAITGSYGKTSTKNYLTQMLKQKYNVLSSPQSYNTPMGVTKTILENLKPYHQILILEFGADHKNDIKKLCKIVSPNVSVVTAVGEQHLKTFKSLNNIIKTKYQIVEGTKPDGFFVTNLNNDICNTYFKNSMVKSYGVSLNDSCNAYCKLLNLNVTKQGMVANLSVNNVPFTLRTNLLGEFNVTNLMLALTVAHNLGVSLEDVQTACNSIYSVKHRLELKHLPNGAVLLDDSFNSNPLGAKCAVETLKLLANKTFVITCGMVELSEKQYEINFKFGSLLTGVTEVMVVNHINYKAICDGIIKFGGKKPKMFNSFLEAYNYALNKSDSNTAILIENDLTDSYIV